MPGSTIHRRMRPVGVIDIGSNSIRLVVYDGNSRTPVPIFNEKSVCALGLGLGHSGRLYPAGVAMATAAVARLVRLARAMKVDRLEVLATAAVRDAADGAEFVANLERTNKIVVQVLDGGREAELAALGVLCGMPDADGLVADLGGGSCELVLVAGGAAGRHVTLPLGLLRMTDAVGDDRARGAELVDRHLAGLDWLTEARDRTLYAVGGAWRTIARVCIAQTGHPLHVLDNFTLERGEAERLLDLISRQSRKSTDKIAGVSRKRLPALPMAALVLEKLCQKVQPSRLVFSVYGMREGRFFEIMPPRLQKQDALIAACSEMARAAGRFPEHADEIMDWMAPLFPGEPAEFARLRRAACLLSDVFWNEHPDYRAEQAFLRVFRLPFMGLGHRDRAFVALAVHARHYGDEEQPYAQQARTLLTESEVRRARAVGQALKLAHSVSGGIGGIIRATSLRVEGRTLVFEVPADDPAFATDITDKRYDRLARAVGAETFVMRRRQPAIAD